MDDSNKIVRFEGMVLEVQPNAEHTWTMNTAGVAVGYGVGEKAVHNHKQRKGDELIEGKHWTRTQSVDASGKIQEMILWTKRGVLKLGFFINSKRGKAFRDWAEDLIIAATDSAPEFRLPQSLPEALRMFADAKENEERLLVENQLQDSTMKKQEAVIEYLEPLAMVGKSYEFQDGCVPVGTFAPVIGFGQNTLFERLRDDKILISQGQRHNQPYARYRDWFEVKPLEIKSGPHAGRPYWQTQITMKGQTKLIKRYQKPIVQHA